MGHRKFQLLYTQYNQSNKDTTYKESHNHNLPLRAAVLQCACMYFR